MAIPEEPQSRVENYLGTLINQTTAALPNVPQSRIEEYLAYIILNGIINLQKGDGVYSIKQTADPSKTGGKFVLNNPNSELNGKA